MKLLLPSGIGDCHWVILKMESFMEKHQIAEPPEVWVASTQDGKDRAGDYLKRVPFIKFCGYFDMRRSLSESRRAFTQGEVLEDFQKFDYLYANNTDVEAGLPPEEWWPKGCLPNFNYPVVPKEIDARAFSQWTNGGPYILVSFYRHGWYADWWAQFAPQAILKELRAAFPEHRLVLTGAAWDRPVGDYLAKESDAVNMMGRTSMGELLGMIRGCDAFVGHAAGNAMMAVHLRRPTVMLWRAPPFKKEMWTCWADPDFNSYVPWDVDCNAAGDLAAKVKEMVGEPSVFGNRG